MNNSDHPINEDTIEAIAASWLVEREEGFAPGRAEAFAQWCERDPRHRAAMAQFEATHRLLQQLPRLRDDDQLARRVERLVKAQAARVIPFPYWRIAAAAAVLALAAAFWWMRPTGDFRQEFATTETGTTNVTLPDKSRVALGGNSAVVVNYSARRRTIELTRGEANFNVAKDAARPFVVGVGKVKVVAVGTIFTVRYGAGSVEVVVSEGKVQVSRQDSAEADTLVSALVAGQKLEVRTDAAGVAGSLQTIDPVGSPAPKSTNRLVFNGTPLSRVIEEFNRRNQVQLVIEGGQIADRPVGGEFEADKVEAFVRALESTGEISAERTDGSTIVLRRGN